MCLHYTQCANTIWGIPYAYSLGVALLLWIWHLLEAGMRRGNAGDLKAETLWFLSAVVTWTFNIFKAQDFNTVFFMRQNLTYVDILKYNSMWWSDMGVAVHPSPSRKFKSHCHNGHFDQSEAYDISWLVQEYKLWAFLWDITPGYLMKIKIFFTFFIFLFCMPFIYFQVWIAAQGEWRAYKIAGCRAGLISARIHKTCLITWFN